MQNKKLIALSILTSSLLFLGCGEEKVYSETPTVVNPAPTKASSVTGTFVDDLVEGLHYECSSGTSGVTNAKGEYTCNTDDNVTFSLGGVTLGTASALNTQITPYTLFPNDNTAAVNLARLLQTINTGSSTNTIIIDSNLEALIPNDTNFSNPTFEVDAQTALNQTLVSEVEARESMNSAIVALGGLIPVVNAHIATGAGDDEIVVATDVNHTLDTGVGSDTVEVVGNIEATTLLGSGDDTLKVGGSVNHTIDAGVGSDTVVINGDVWATQVLGEGDDSLHVLGDVHHTIQMGNGNDRLVIDGDVVNATQVLGDGDDYLYVGGSVSHNLNGGVGLDTLVLGGYSAADWAINKDNIINFVYSFSTITSSDGVTLTRPSVVPEPVYGGVNLPPVVPVVQATVPVLKASVGHIHENAAEGTAVGNLNILNPGKTAITQISLSGNGSQNFTIDTLGALRVAPNASLDYEVKNEYNLSAIATNSLGSSNSVNIVVSILNVFEELIAVQAVNRAPVANELNTSVAQNSASNTISLSASDDDNDTLTYSIVSSVQNGTLSLVTNQAEYTPNANYNGNDSFTYKVNDGTVDSLTVTVNITVTSATFVSGNSWNNFIYNTVVSPTTGRVWLDRNIGATQVCTAHNDVDCYGDYFQWGRDADTHEKQNSMVSVVVATSVRNSGVTSFVQNSSVPFDWTSADSNGSERSQNWSATNGNSVCPTGFRLPTMSELVSDTLYAGVQVRNNIDAFNNFLHIPSAGRREYYSGTITHQGSEALLWSSETQGTNSRFVYFEGSAGRGSGLRASARAVRCIQN